MKICICYEKDCGGETVATQAILYELRQRKNIKVKDFSSAPLTNTSTLGYFSWITVSIFRWLNIIARHQNLDWVYTTTYTAGVAAAILKPISYFHICFHYHGNRIPPPPTYLSLKTTLTQWGKRWLVTFLHHVAFLTADTVIVPFEDTYQLLIKQFPYIKHDTFVVPNGVDIERFKNVTLVDQNRVRKKYGLTKKQKLVTYVGRLTEDKRIDLFIQTLPFLKKTYPDICYIIAYPGIINQAEIAYKSSLLRLITKLDLSSNVLWIKNSSDLPAVYVTSDVVILLSKKENFPLVLLESAAAKTLFIGSAISPIFEFLKQINERLILKHDKPEVINKQITKILSLSLKEKRHATTKAYRKVKGLTWRKTAASIYHKLRATQF